MGLKLITAPAIEPVSIAQAKAQTRVDTNNDARAVAGVVTGATGAGAFRVSGDVLSLLTEGETVTVAGSTGNDGSYTLRAGSSYSSGSDETTLNVDESVANATADGTFTIVDPLETELAGMITAARVMAEAVTWRALITQVWDLSWRGFPDGGRRIVLPKPPLISVDAINYIDPDGNVLLLASSAYEVTTGSPGEVQPVAGTSWPDTKDVPAALVLTFTAGYGNAASNVPATLRQAIKLQVGEMYERREPKPNAKFSTLDALITPYVVRNRHMTEFV